MIPQTRRLAVLAVVLAASPSAAQVSKLYPVDEAARDPSFFLFRARLSDAVQTRDTSFLYGILAPDLLNSFGGDGGPEEFKERWRPGAPESELWGMLAGLLARGGWFLGDTLFMAPYTAGPAPADPYGHVVIMGENVAVRSEPDSRARRLAALSFDVIAVPGGWREVEGGERRWVQVELADATVGWVAKEYVRSLIDYRVAFARRDGRWWLRVLVAGD